MVTPDSGDDPEPDELRAKATECEAIADALEDLLTELQTEQIQKTRLEGLFDEATTSDPGIWNTVTAFIDVEDGKAVVTDESKLAEGTWAPEIVADCDAMVTTDVYPGLMPEEFTTRVGTKLAETITENRERAEEARQEGAALESADE